MLKTAAWHMNASNSLPSFVACNVLVSTQGIEASRVMESEGIQTHMTFVYRWIVVEACPSNISFVGYENFEWFFILIQMWNSIYQVIITDCCDEN